jgi:hypothetical protein
LILLEMRPSSKSLHTFSILWTKMKPRWNYTITSISFFTKKKKIALFPPERKNLLRILQMMIKSLISPSMSPLWSSTNPTNSLCHSGTVFQSEYRTSWTWTSPIRHVREKFVFKQSNWSQDE